MKKTTEMKSLPVDCRCQRRWENSERKYNRFEAGGLSNLFAYLYKQQSFRFPLESFKEKAHTCSSLFVRFEVQ